MAYTGKKIATIKVAYLTIFGMLKSKFFWLVVLLGVGIVLYILSRTPGGEETTEVPDTPVDIVEHSEILDAYRADWSIYERFESWPTVIPLAKISEIAYGDAEDATARFKELGFENIVPIKSPLHTQIGYVVSAEDVMVIAFRGSDDTEDWILNINQYIHQGDDGGMHAGFSTCYSTLRQDVLKVVVDANPKPKHIWITGHSLGGALALICAYDFQRYHSVEFDGVFTFGQPMVGREQFTGYLQNNLGDRYVHFVNELDGVPRIPAGFSHCGRLIWFKNGKVKTSSRYRKVMTMVHNGADPAVDDDLEYVDDDDFPAMSKQEFDKLRNDLESKEELLFPEDQVIPNETLQLDEIPFGLRQPLQLPRLRGFGDETPEEIEIDDPKWLEELPFEWQKFEPGDRPVTGLFIDPLPWKTDHGMTEYIQKIEARIEKVKRESNE